jgi:hypothetical protein
MYNRIAFGGSFFVYYWNSYLPDANKREFFYVINVSYIYCVLWYIPCSYFRWFTLFNLLFIIFSR